MTPEQSLHTARAVRYSRGVLAAATAVSLAGNVEHAWITHRGSASLVPLAFALAWAAIAPLTLPTAVHLAGLLAKAGGRSWARATVAVGVLSVAGLAFWASYAALRAITMMMGYPPSVAAIYPLLIDLLATLATGALLALDRGDVPADVPADLPARQPVEPDQQHVPVTDWQAPVGMAGTVAAGQPVYQQRSAAAPTMTGTDDHPGHHPLHLVPTAAGPGAGGAGPTDAVEQQARQLVEQGVTRLPANQVAEVLRCSARGASQRAIGRELSIDRRTVAGIVAAAGEEAEAVGV